MCYVSYFIEVVVVESVVCVVGGVSSISFLWLLLLLSSSSSLSAMPTRHHHRCQKNTRTHTHTYTHFQLEKNQRRSDVYCSVLHAVLAYTIQYLFGVFRTVCVIFCSIVVLHRTKNGKKRSVYTRIEKSCSNFFRSLALLLLLLFFSRGSQQRY